MTMNNPFRYLLFAGTLFGMSFTMPSCPGQQALQEQVEAMKQSQAEQLRKVSALEAQLKTANADIGQMKQAMETLNSMGQAQKAATDQMSAALTELNNRMAAKAAPSKTSARKKGH